MAGTRPRLWAALRVNQSVFWQGETKDLTLTFTLINDSAEVVAPRIGESRLLINGREAAYSGWVPGSGPGDGHLDALPPGAVLEFGRRLGTYFGEPGTYRVSWEVLGFRSHEVCFRVLPEDEGGVSSGHTLPSPPAEDLPCIPPS